MITSRERFLQRRRTEAVGVAFLRCPIRFASLMISNTGSLGQSRIYVGAEGIL